MKGAAGTTKWNFSQNVDVNVACLTFILSKIVPT